MLKKVAILIGVLSLCLVIGATSYSRAYIKNETNLQIVRSQNALIAINTSESVFTLDAPTLTQGDDSGTPANDALLSASTTVRVTNNSVNDIKIESIRCKDSAFNSHYTFGYTPIIPSGQAQVITITLHCDAADIPGIANTFIFDCSWENGEASEAGSGEATIEFAVDIRAATQQP